MNSRDYQQLISELCNTVGLGAVQGVIETQHLTIDGVTVGLIFDEKISPSRIFLYIDLGALADDQKASLHERMLTSNVRADGAATGHFGIHPTTRHAVYHVRVGFTPELTGAELAKFLHYHVLFLQNWTDRCLAPPRPTKSASPRTTRTGTVNRLPIHHHQR